MAVEEFDNLIIGSGEAGKYLAWNLARMGQKTAVVERSLIGGSCPNIACLPSKNIIHSAKAVSLVDSVKGLGVVQGTTHVDMPGVTRRKRRMVDELVEVHLRNYQSSGAALIMGEARFTKPKTVRVTTSSSDDRYLSGNRVTLDRSARPIVKLISADPLPIG